jgi:hypothetical protein
MHLSANETSVLPLWISLAAVIVGPLVSLKISKRQMISPMRQKWIDELRELMSVILSECQNVIVMGEGRGLLNDEKSDGALFQKLLYLEKKLNLMLDPFNDGHIALLRSVNKITDAVHHGVGNLLDFGASVDCSTQLTQKILKIEWERVAGKKNWIDAWI